MSMQIRKQDAGPSAGQDTAYASSNPPPPLVVRGGGGDDDEAMSATSAASSPRSHFSDDTIDLIPADEPLAPLEGPPATTPLRRDEDTASPPPAYSRDQPADSIWPATGAVPPVPSPPPSPPPPSGRAVMLAETQPLTAAWGPGRTAAMEQVHGHRYGLAHHHHHGGGGGGYGTLVQVNNYGIAAPMAAPADADAEWGARRGRGRGRGHRCEAHGGRGRGRRGRGRGVPDFGRFNCRCCCCACMCSRLTLVVVGFVAVVLVVLAAVALGFGLPEEAKRPRFPGDGGGGRAPWPSPGPGDLGDCQVTICLPRFLRGEGPCHCLVYERKGERGSQGEG